MKNVYNEIVDESNRNSIEQLLIELYNAFKCFAETIFGKYSNLSSMKC